MPEIGGWLYHLYLCQESTVPCRRWMLAVVALAAFLCSLQAFAQQPSAPQTTTPPQAKPEWTEIPVQAAEPSGAPSSPSSIPQIKLRDFTSCSIADLRHSVRELRHLQPAGDQSQLSLLLDKIGAKTVESANKTPNLISREEVITERGNMREKQEFSFLILQHAFGHNARILDEYRVDVATGEKIETDFIDQAARSSASSSSDLPSAHALLPSPGPTSQGFASSWLYFYPANRPQFEFRYLGKQQIDGHRALVVAVAQKPAWVRLPALFELANRSYPIFMQGIAWVDASNFSILRLRLEPLSIPVSLPLRQLTIDIQFRQVSVADATALLWVPAQLEVTTNLAGSISHETHKYSNYRVFRTRSSIVLK